VKGFLVDEGVAGSRINAIGYGETRPKASNDTPEGRQLNRRVEIHIRSTATQQ
jgi:outer membrane protein OmpA-like peptidoglycan-associated protein